MRTPTFHNLLSLCVNIFGYHFPAFFPSSYSSSTFFLVVYYRHWHSFVSYQSDWLLYLVSFSFRFRPGEKKMFFFRKQNISFLLFWNRAERNFMILSGGIQSIWTDEMSLSSMKLLRNEMFSFAIRLTPESRSTISIGAKSRNSFRNNCLIWFRDERCDRKQYSPTPP